MVIITMNVMKRETIHSMKFTTYAIPILGIALIVSLSSCGKDNPVDSEMNPEPSFNFDGDLIAFRSDRDGNDDIWLMTPDGSESINITNHSSAETDPTWSPDGSKIAFVSTRTGNAELFMMDVDGSNVIQVTDNQGSIRWPKWSPDGSLIAFSSNVNNQRDIYVVPAPDAISKQSKSSSVGCEDPLQVTDHPETDNEPVWSPDGSKMYFFSTRDGIGGVWELEFNCEGGSNLLKLTIEFEFGCAPTVGWSLLDGKAKLSFVGEKNGQYDIWTMDLDGSNQMNVTNDPGTDWTSTWTDDGDQLFFDSDRNDNWDIFSVNEDGSGLTQITDHPADDRYPAWRP